MEKFSNAWKSSTQCDGCSARLNVFRRKKPCFSCKNYFCQFCIMRQPDKKMCCRKCQVLTATPLDRNDLLNLRSRDLVNYLASRHISTSGCVEKEDLVNVLMRTVNNSTSSSSCSVGNSGDSSYFNDPGNNSVSDIQSFSNSSHISEQLYNEDGIRITGTNLPENEESRSSSIHSYNSEIINESDWIVNGSTAENSEITHENNFYNSENVHLENAIETEIASSESSNSNNVNEVKLKKEKSKPLKLSDISCSADLDHLSVKELKKLLITNRTDYKGCIERAELIEKACRLWSDYTLSRKDLEKLSLEELCKICMDAPIECVLLECGHMATCMTCGKQLAECPVCRQFVVRCVRTFKV